MKVPVKVIKSYAGHEFRPELQVADSTEAEESGNMKRKKDQERYRSAAEEIPAALDSEDQCGDTGPEFRTGAEDCGPETETPAAERPAP